MDAATHNSPTRIRDVIHAAHRPERLSVKRWNNFRHQDVDLAFPMEYFDQRRAAAESRRRGELVDIPLIPCGPRIDIRQFSSSFSMLRLPRAISAEEQICIICLDPLREQTCVRLRTCEHCFHTECMTTWVNTRTSIVTCLMYRAYVCRPRRIKRGCIYCE